MSEDTWILGVVPTIPADVVTTPNEIVLMQTMVNAELPAQEVTLQALLAATTGGGSGGGSSTSKIESLWTDDSNAFYVRIDTSGTITWQTVFGVTSSAPGTGIRPVGGTSALITSSTYLVTTAATGYAVGDYLSHIVTTDPVTGAVIGFFWINITQNATLSSAPASANISPFSSLPTGASTAANQTTSNSSLSTIATQTAALGTTADTSATNSTSSWSAVALLKGLYAKLMAGVSTSALSLSTVLASDQASIPSYVSPPQVLSQPASITLAALNNTAQWQVQGGANYYLTVTNLPNVTATFAGTVSFQYSLNGTTWNALNAVPLSGGPTAQVASSTTAVGLWSIAAPSGATVYIQANMTAWTSGSAVVDISPTGVSNGSILLPWTPGLTSGNVIIAPIDVSGMSELALQVNAITTTVLNIQGTNDPTLTTWTNISPQLTSASVTALTISSLGNWRAPTYGFKWVQVVVTTTGTVFSVLGAQAKVGSATTINSSGSSLSTTVNSGTITTVITVTGVTAANLNFPGIIQDQVSAAITTTTTSAAVAPTFGVEYEINEIVTAVSGTSPTLDLVVQESDDGGVNWYDVYHFPRITAVGAYRSPKLIIKGSKVRYVETVGGTTPSFTRSRNRLQGSSGITALIRRIFDRAVSLTTLSATTTTAAGNPLNVQDCRNLQLTIAVGAVTTTAPALQLQGSEDGGVTWTLIGSPLLSVASSTVSATVSNVNWELVRAIVTTAGVGVTAGYVAIKGF